MAGNGDQRMLKIGKVTMEYIAQDRAIEIGHPRRSERHTRNKV